MKATGCRNSVRRTAGGLRRALAVLLAVLLMAQFAPVTALAEDAESNTLTATVHRHTESCYETDAETGEQVLTCTIPETETDEDGVWLAGELSGALEELEGDGALAIFGGQIAEDGTYSATVTATKNKDGKTYTGTVYVTVSDGKISGLSIYASDKNDRFQDALYEVMDDLVGKPAAPDTVDAVSSASLSGRSSSAKYSIDLLPAIKRALQSADPAAGDSSGSTVTPVADGVYRGSYTMSNGHYITLDVTVQDGVIATLSIVEADGSWDSLLQSESGNYVGNTAAMETVDAVSSATSLGYREAIKNAILDALGGTPLEEPQNPEQPQDPEQPGGQDNPTGGSVTESGGGISLTKGVNVTNVVETTEVTLDLEALSTAQQVVTSTEGKGANIVMVIDTSGSIIGKETALNKAIQNLAASLPDGSQIGVVVFNDSASAGTIYTKETISRLSFSGTDSAGTVISSGLNNAQSLLNGGGWQNPDNSKVIILISDGQDDGIGDAINAARPIKAAGTLIYTVNIDETGIRAPSTQLSNASANGNSVMQYISSNYPDAAAEGAMYGSWIWGGTVTPGSGSYDAGYCFGAAGGDWGSIFSTIQHSVISYETVTLDSAAVFQDQANTEIFDVSGATATVTVYDYADGAWTALPGSISVPCGGSAELASWQGKAAGDGVISLEFAPDGVIDISGFSYQDHYLPENGEEAAGVNAQKLHLTISGLKLKDGVRTEEDQKDVPTNVENRSGLYADGSADVPDKCFPVPHVNIPAKETPVGTMVFGCSLSLRGNIGLNFYLIPTEDVLADPGAYVEMNGVKYPVAEATTRVEGENTLYRFTAELPAKQMNDVVTLRLYSGEDKLLPLIRQGKDISATGLQFTVQEYIERTRNESDNEVLIALVNAMSDYGSCAQAFFQYDLESRADIRGDLNAVTLEDLAAYQPKLTTTGKTGLTYQGSSLVLRSETAIRHYFTLDEGEIGDYTFTVGKITLTPEQGEQGWYVEVPNIYARYLNRTYVVTATGPEGKIFTVRYSALSYAKNVLEQQEDAALQDLARAMFLYNKAAIAYFASLEGR